MNLGKPPGGYSQQHAERVQSQLEQADKQNIKVGAVFDKILMRDTVTGTIVALTVASGALVIT